MENGVEVVDEHLLGVKGVQDGFSESRLGEKGLVESHQSKDSEGDDFFEEAIDMNLEDLSTSQVELPSQTTIHKQGAFVNENSDSLESSGDPKLGNDAKAFEEAVGISGENGNHEVNKLVGVEEKVETLNGNKPVNVISNEDDNEKEEGLEENAVTDDLNWLDNNGSAGNEEDNRKEVLDDHSTDSEMEVFNDGYQVNHISENGPIVDLNVKEIHLVDEYSDHRNGSSEECKDDKPDGQLLQEEDENEKPRDFLVEQETKNQDLNSEEHKDDTSSDHQAEEHGELNETIPDFSIEHHNEQSGKVKAASASSDPEHRNNEIEELNNTSVKLDAEQPSGEDEVSNSVTANVAIENQDDPGTEMKNNLGNMAANEGDENMEPKGSADITDSEHDGESSPLTDSRLEKNGNVIKQEDLQKQEVADDQQKTESFKEKEISPAASDVATSPSSSVKSTNHTAAPARPAGLGRAAPLLEPASRVAQQQSRVNGTVSQLQSQLVEEPNNGDSDEHDETREKLQMIRVKFLRLAYRLGQTPHNVVVAQVLYRLGLAEQLRGRNGGRVGAFSFDRASAMAEQLESTGQEPLDFSCTIMVIGKTGVGKSATINSIFDEVMFNTDAFQLGTKKVQDVVGMVQGIKVRVIDTPGLLPSWSDQRHNEKILQSVKMFIKKTPPDIVLYLDRLDMQSRDFGDMPLLRTITEIFGPSIWFNAIVVLTHAASAPPDGPNGTASSYDMFVTQRSHVVQQAIRQAAGDMRLMNPVSLVENHSACRTNRAGQRVLPNGQVWKPHLLLLSFASKILAEANTLLKLQDSPPGKPFATRSRAPPLPFLLSSLLQSRPQLKLPEEQFGDEEDNGDEELDESSDSDSESEYDELPPFKRLTKAQLAKLTKAQKKAYFDELEYREKLFMKKQLKEERKRRKMLRKMAAMAKDLPNEYGENLEEESGGAASVPVPMPDLSLPASFDSDNPTHRYRYLDSSNQWLVRPVLESHGWDHDVGYEGINVERMFVIKEKIPVSFSGQVSKDKKESNLQMEVASSVKHGEGKSTSLGFDMQTVGKDIAYTLRSETRFSNYRKNKATAGISATLLGDALTAGIKFEDKLIVNKQFRMVVTGGAMTGRGDVAYGGSLEATLRDKDYPLGRSLSTLGLSVMDWHGDLAIGCNLQSQIPIGRSSNMIARANLNNRGAGQVSIRFNTSEQLQIALVGLLPLFRKLLSYPQQMQFGQS